MQLHEIAYFTDDVPAMQAFYERLLGAGPVAASEDMAIFQSGGAKLFIHRAYPAEEGPLPPENHIAFQVSDVDAHCAELQRKGVIAERQPQDYYWGRSAYLRDPDGHLIELIAGADAG